MTDTYRPEDLDWAMDQFRSNDDRSSRRVLSDRTKNRKCAERLSGRAFRKQTCASIYRAENAPLVRPKPARRFSKLLGFANG